MTLITKEFLKQKFTSLKHKQFEFNPQLPVNENIDQFLKKAGFIQRTQLCKGQSDVFIAHNLADKHLLAGIVALFWESGYSTYVLGLEEPTGKKIPFTRQSTESVKKYVDSCKCSIYVYDEDSPEELLGKWLLAYADGKLGGRSALMPITNNETDFYEVPETLWHSLYIQIKTGEFTGEELCVVADQETWGGFQFWLKGWGLFENPLNDYMRKRNQKWL